MARMLTRIISQVCKIHRLLRRVLKENAAITFRPEFATRPYDTSSNLIIFDGRSLAEKARRWSKHCGIDNRMSLRVFSALLLCYSLAAQAASAQPLTFQRDDRPSTLRARGIAVADFKRDGWIDIVTAHHDPDGIAVLLNHGAAGGQRWFRHTSGVAPSTSSPGPQQRRDPGHRGRQRRRESRQPPLRARRRRV